jgi:hypothetical protein
LLRIADRLAGDGIRHTDNGQGGVVRSFEEAEEMDAAFQRDPSRTPARNDAHFLQRLDRREHLEIATGEG